jgi:hypothetical protein
MRATEQRRMTVHVSEVHEAMRRAGRGALCTAGAAGRCSLTATGPFDDFQHAAIDRGRAERARDGGVAFLGNGVAAGRTDVDRVMTGGAMLDDRAAPAKRERIVAAADDDLALTSDVDIVASVPAYTVPLPKTVTSTFPLPEMLTVVLTGSLPKPSF